MEPKQSTLINAQLALFFTTLLPRPDKLTEGLNKALDNIFDSIPLITPVPSQAELAEIPVVQWTSEKNIQCKVPANGQRAFL